ncbi:c-type cytochrome domain-containing protein [Planctomicrobium sp. SH527]|uniref:c-type cytochrome domain-containing protein n=1 Tax=Planctomicrobium sp. SH527 TaxID=3448123 RepID=UPI003F5C4E76
MNRKTCLLVAIAACWIGPFDLTPSVRADASNPAQVEFYRDIAPILRAKCQACHSASVHEGDLRLDDHALTLKGGESGAPVVPGDAEKSLLYLVSTRKEEPAMPPLPNGVQATALTDAELDLLKRWINGGAIAGARTGSTAKWRNLPAAQQTVYSLAMSPDQQLLAAGRGNRVVLYDMLTLKEAGSLSDPRIDGRTDRDYVQAIAFSPDGRTIATGGYRSVKLWQPAPPVRIHFESLPQPVRAVQVSEQGDRAAFLSGPAQITIFNLQTGKPEKALPAGATQITSMAFSAHGKGLTTGDTTGLVQFWNLETATVQDQFQSGSAIHAMVMRADTPGLATSHADSVIRLWPIEEMAPERKPVLELKGHTQPAERLSITGKQHLLSAGPDKLFRLWDLSNGNVVWSHELPFPITDIQTSADGKRHVVLGNNGHAQLLNEEGKLVARLENGRTVHEAVDATENHEIAKRLLERTAERLKQAEADFNSREQILKNAEAKLQATKETVTKHEQELQQAKDQEQQANKALAEAPNDAAKKKEVATSVEKVKKSTEQLAKSQKAAEADSRAVILAKQAVQFGADQLERRRSESAESTQEVADKEKLATEATQRRNEFATQFSSISIDDSRGTILAAAGDQTVHLWNLQTGTPLIPPALPSPVTRLQSVGQDRLFTMTTNGSEPVTVTHWNTSPQWELKKTLGPQAGDLALLDTSSIQDRVMALAFSPDGQTLVSGGGEPSRGGELLFWNLNESDKPIPVPDAHSDTVLSVQFSRDGSKLVTGGADKFCKVFDTAKRSQIQLFEGHTDHVMGVAFNADGNLVASGAADRLIKVWDLDTGEIRRTIDNYAKQVTSVRFIGNTNRIVSSNGDTSVKIHVTSDGKNERTFSAAKDYLYCNIISPDGLQVIAGGREAVIHIWDATTGKVITSFGPTSTPDASVSK